MTYWMTLLMALAIPFAMLFIGLIMAKKPPKRINHFCGYRTKRSMSNPEAWRFANALAGKMMCVLGAILLVVSAIPMLCVMKQSETVWLTLSTALCGFHLAALISTPIYVERILAKTFGAEDEKED